MVPRGKGGEQNGKTRENERKSVIKKQEGKTQQENQKGEGEDGRNYEKKEKGGRTESEMAKTESKRTQSANRAIYKIK